MAQITFKTSPAVLRGAARQAELQRDREAAAKLAKLAPRRKPRQPGTGPHIIDPAKL